MNRREFLSLLAGSGLMAAAGRTFGQQPATTPLPVGSVATDCALNPIRPYLNGHPLPWPAAKQTGAREFDLINWTSSPGGRSGAKNVAVGTFRIENDSGGASCKLIRTTADDVTTMRIQSANDAWQTPQAWTCDVRPTMETPFPLEGTLRGSLVRGQLTTGRGPNMTLQSPLVSMAALLSSLALLRTVLASSSPLYVLSESGAVLGPLKASARPAITGSDGKPIFNVAALWGPSLVPTHIVYDDSGTAAFTGLLISGVRNTIK